METHGQIEGPLPEDRVALIYSLYSGGWYYLSKVPGFFDSFYRDRDPYQPPGIHDFMGPMSLSSNKFQRGVVAPPRTAGLIYENLEKMKKFEPKYRLKRVGALPDGQVVEDWQVVEVFG